MSKELNISDAPLASVLTQLSILCLQSGALRQLMSGNLLIIDTDLKPRNLDELTETGIYLCKDAQSETTTGVPAMVSGKCNGAYAIVLKVDTKNCFQFLLTRAIAKLLFRMKYVNEWKSWYEIPLTVVPAL